MEPSLLECCEEELPETSGRIDGERFTCPGCEQNWIWFDLVGQGGWYNNTKQSQ
jgi:hypothetical protein